MRSRRGKSESWRAKAILIKIIGDYVVIDAETYNEIGEYVGCLEMGFPGWYSVAVPESIRNQIKQEMILQFKELEKLPIITYHPEKGDSKESRIYMVARCIAELGEELKRLV